VKKGEILTLPKKFNDLPEEPADLIPTVLREIPANVYTNDEVSMFFRILGKLPPV
jgi:hypothetical protein